MAYETPLTTDFDALGRLKKALEKAYGVLPEEVSMLLDELQDQQLLERAENTVLKEENAKSHADLIRAKAEQERYKAKMNIAVLDKKKAEQVIAERDKTIAEQDRLIEAYQDGMRYEVKECGTVVVGEGCNVMTKPVYGAQIQAGHGAMMTVTPQKPDPEDQRPPLIVSELPAVLQTPRAIAYWQQMYDEGLVDNECQSQKPKRETAYMAKRMGNALGISGYIKMFEDLWGMTNLNSYTGSSLDFKKGWDIKEKLDKIFGEEPLYKS